MNLFVFDIETIPDVETGRAIYALDGIDDADVARAMQHMRLQKTGSDFLPHHLQRIVAISVVMRSGEQLKVWSLGEEESGEAELVQRFFDGIEKYQPNLVSWNGGGFDLPVLHYRALKHGVRAAQYWETGDSDRDFKWNNYISRYHSRHLDLMDVLAMYQPRANAPLDQIAVSCGFPGKLGMDGSKVWDAWLAGDVAGIRNYCETDVLNTYLVYLRFEVMRGNLGETEFQRECKKLRDYLGAGNKPHFSEFVSAWKSD